MASMVKLVDTADLKSAASRNGACRFDPGSRHQIFGILFGRYSRTGPPKGGNDEARCARRVLSRRVWANAVTQL